MPNHPKNPPANEREENDASRSRETMQKTGESQDAIRHQKDAAHHKGHKSPPRDASDRLDPQSPAGLDPEPTKP
jgi:hypothetical protein